MSRALKELRGLVPFSWDARVEAHPAGEAAMRDFKNAFNIGALGNVAAGRSSRGPRTAVEPRISKRAAEYKSSSPVKTAKQKKKLRISTSKSSSPMDMRSPSDDGPQKTGAEAASVIIRTRESPASVLDVLATPAGHTPGKAAREGTDGPGSGQEVCQTEGAKVSRGGDRGAAAGGVRKAIRLLTPTPDRAEALLGRLLQSAEIGTADLRPATLLRSPCQGPGPTEPAIGGGQERTVPLPPSAGAGGQEPCGRGMVAAAEPVFAPDSVGDQFPAGGATQIRAKRVGQRAGGSARGAAGPSDAARLLTPAELVAALGTEPRTVCHERTREVLALASTSPVFRRRTHQRRAAAAAPASAVLPSAGEPAVAGAQGLLANPAVVAAAASPVTAVATGTLVSATPAAAARGQASSDGTPPAAQAALPTAAQQGADSGAAPTQQSDAAAVDYAIAAAAPPTAASDAAQAAVQPQLRINPLEVLPGSIAGGGSNTPPVAVAEPLPSNIPVVAVAGMQYSDAPQKAGSSVTHAVTVAAAPTQPRATVTDGSAATKPVMGALVSGAQPFWTGVGAQGAGPLRRVPMGPPAPRKPITAMPRGPAGAGHPPAVQRKKVITFRLPPSPPKAPARVPFHEMDMNISNAAGAGAGEASRPKAQPGSPAVVVPPVSGLQSKLGKARARLAVAPPSPPAARCQLCPVAPAYVPLVPSDGGRGFAFRATAVRRPDPPIRDRRKLKPMTFENGCELLRWLEEAEAFALAALENRHQATL